MNWSVSWCLSVAFLFAQVTTLYDEGSNMQQSSNETDFDLNNENVDGKLREVTVSTIDSMMLVLNSLKK